MEKLQEGVIYYTSQIDGKKFKGKDLAILFNNRGHLKYLLVEFDSALEDYKNSIEIFPDLPVVYYNKGVILYRLGYFEEALRDMETAIRLDGTNKEYLEGFAECKKMSLKC